MILPLETATMSTRPNHAQISASVKTATRQWAPRRPIGEGGVSTISRAAGRNSRSTLRMGLFWTGTTAVVIWRSFIRTAFGSGLHGVKLGVAAAAAQQVLMGAVLGDASALDSQDAVGDPHRYQPVRDDEDGAA